MLCWTNCKSDTVDSARRINKHFCPLLAESDAFITPHVPLGSVRDPMFAPTRSNVDVTSHVAGK